MNPSIILLVPYFGRWPVWFDFFLVSASHNPDIKWQFFTDCEIPVNKPDNIDFETLSFADYKKMVSERLGIKFNPESAYKLCDIKPALGFIHADKTEGYDFWGVTDIDLVYGDLRSYFTAERLAEKDFYSTHERRVSGHLFLARNTQKMREAFKQIKNWQERFGSKEHYALDEGAFSRLFIRHKNLPQKIANFLLQLNPWYRKSEFIEAYSTTHGRVPWVDGSYQFPTEWCWQKGKLTNNLTGEREFPYFHFIAWKQNEWVDHAKFEQLDLGTQMFKINPDGMFSSCKKQSESNK